MDHWQNRFWKLWSRICHQWPLHLSERAREPWSRCPKTRVLQTPQLPQPPCRDLYHCEQCPIPRSQPPWEAHVEMSATLQKSQLLCGAHGEMPVTLQKFQLTCRDNVEMSASLQKSQLPCKNHMKACITIKRSPVPCKRNIEICATTQRSLFPFRDRVNILQPHRDSCFCVYSMQIYLPPCMQGWLFLCRCRMDYFVTWQRRLF